MTPVILNIVLFELSIGSLGPNERFVKKDFMVRIESNIRQVLYLNR